MYKKNVKNDLEIYEKDWHNWLRDSTFLDFFFFDIEDHWSGDLKKLKKRDYSQERMLNYFYSLNVCVCLTVRMRLGEIGVGEMSLADHLSVKSKIVQKWVQNKNVLNTVTVSVVRQCQGVTNSCSFPHRIPWEDESGVPAVWGWATVRSASPHASHVPPGVGSCIGSASYCGHCAKSIRHVPAGGCHCVNSRYKCWPQSTTFATPAHPDTIAVGVAGCTVDGGYSHNSRRCLHVQSLRQFICPAAQSQPTHSLWMWRRAQIWVSGLPQEVQAQAQPRPSHAHPSESMMIEPVTQGAS